MESWLQTIHPEDRVGALLEMERALAGNGDLHHEFRIVRPDGAVRRVRSRGRTLHSREGKPLRMVGVCFDITEAGRMEISLRASEERFSTAVETLMDCLGKEGPGIGFALVKSIVELHGGLVRAASGRLGEGSEFVVELPLRGEPAPAAPAAAGDPAMAGAAPRSRRILVVDDSLDTAESLTLLLELGGHEVRTAHEGARALEVAQGFQPDVVLLDIGLPRMDGYEVAEHLRRRPETRRSLLIAISGYGQDEDRQKALAAGFDHHLIKPVDYEALKALILSPPPG